MMMITIFDTVLTEVVISGKEPAAVVFWAIMVDIWGTEKGELG